MRPLPKQANDPLTSLAFLSLFAVLPFWDILAPVMLAFVLLTGVFLNRQTHFPDKIKANKGLLLLILYFLLASISLVYTSTISESIEKVLKLTAFLFIPLAFLLVNPDKSLLEKAKKVFVFSCMVFCVFSLLSLVYNFVLHREIAHHYHFVQSAMYSEYMPEDAMFLNTALAFVLFGSFSKSYKLFIGLLFLIVIVLFGVRLGLGVYLLILIIYGILHFKQLLKLQTLVVLIVAVLGSIYLINNNPYVNDKFYGSLAMLGFDTSERVSEITEDYHHLGVRNEIWKSSLTLIKEKPVLGHGAGAEKFELNKIYEAKGLELIGFNSHNQFLSTFVQYGAIGFLWLVALFFVLLRKTIVHRNLTGFLVIGVMGISMFTESYLEIQQGIFYFCIFVPLILMGNKQNKSIEN